ncbi:DUF2637 domain-containing protein [Streptomyces sp. NPDC093546]|uniref:DUF2637 domain-containing protein n=1 Tax=Streptomyces sp. NPDC093546 TaxID=3366040 RepID=UPI00380174B5
MYEHYGRDARQPLAPLGSLDMADLMWDPAEELACLLQESAAPGRTPGRATDRPSDRPSDWAADAGTVAPDRPMERLEQITAELPPVRPPQASHRRVPAKRSPVTLLRTGSVLIAALAAVIVSMVSVYGGMVAYDPLRHIAESHTSHDAVRWWPLLVYGPWMVGSLCILRTALHRRRAAHSWCVVLLFSTIAMLLCIAQAPRTVPDIATAALPSVAALACFQQLVRQITLTRPPRQRAPRHRSADTG